MVIMAIVVVRVIGVTVLLDLLGYSCKYSSVPSLTHMVEIADR